MRVLLINEGNYMGLDDVDFPVIVEASEIDEFSAAIPTSELVRVGGFEFAFDDNEDQHWPFIIGSECEVIE